MRLDSTTFFLLFLFAAISINLNLNWNIVKSCCDCEGSSVTYNCINFWWISNPSVAHRFDLSQFSLAWTFNNAHQIAHWQQNTEAFSMKTMIEKNNFELWQNDSANVVTMCEQNHSLTNKVCSVQIICLSGDSKNRKRWLCPCTNSRSMY